MCRSDVPVYSEGKLQLDKIAVFKQGAYQYYSQVTLLVQDDGDFHLQQASKHSLAIVDTAEVIVTPATSGTAAQVTVRTAGVLSLACESLLDPLVISQEGGVHIVLAQTLQEKGEVCMSLAVTPFNIDISLDTYKLAPGDYVLHVNDFQTSFSVPAN